LTWSTHSKLLIDNVTWARTSKNVIEVVHPKLIVQNSIFPDHDDEESIHGHGLAGDEYLIIRNNIFGRPAGYQDVLDFSGCQRPGPIVQVYDNLFLGGEDDGLDLDGADAHIEGNLFKGFLGGTGTGTPNPIAADAGSEITVARNVFVGNINGVLLKGGSEMVASNNTFVGQSGTAVRFYESGSSLGKGAHLQGNIFWNNAEDFRDVGPGVELTVDYSMLGSSWHYLGTGNLDGDPLFVDPNADFHLRPASGAIGTGAWRLDMGAYVPAGAAVSGEPEPVTYRTSATLTVGGPGITHYRYSLNSPTGPWSAELSVDVPIELTALADGQSYTVYVIGKNSAGVWQSESQPSASGTWTVDTSYRRLVINEVLAHTHGADPDLIELYYDGPGPIDLTGMGLTDNPLEPHKFTFNSQTVSTTTMNPGDYMLLYGDLLTMPDHIGFALLAEGEGLYLYDKDGLTLVDSVEFGQQINGYSIGRVGYDRQWRLNVPTLQPPRENIFQPTGNVELLKINEWLASGRVLFDDDFIELYNPQPYPVALAGLYLTDNPITQPAKHRVVPLSYIPPDGYAVFSANDGNEPSELGFRLSGDGEMIGLFDADLKMIDQVVYRPQTTDVSQGRAPNGSANYEFFELPTPRVANPKPTTVITTTITLVSEDAEKRAIVPLSAGHIGAAWNSDPGFDDSNWAPVQGAPGGVGYERGSGNYDDYFSLDVEADMYNKNETCYIRIPFNVDGAQLADYTGLTLKIRYDDGFVAYINGIELTTARRNFSGTPQWDSGADSGHSDTQAKQFELIDISNYIGALIPGENLLAIHGLNRGTDSSDFLISAELEASITTIDTGEFPWPEALDLLEALRITELMYNAPQGSNYDYIELQNIGEKMLDLEGVRFVDGVEFVFPPMLLGPGEYVVVVANQVAFGSVHGYSINVAGEYTGGLSGGGERIVLSLAWPLEAAVMRFEYNDAWYPTTDGGGESLTIADPTAEPARWSDRDNWCAAAPSPGGP